MVVWAAFRLRASRLESSYWDYRIPSVDVRGCDMGWFAGEILIWSYRSHDHVMLLILVWAEMIVVYRTMLSQD